MAKIKHSELAVKLIVEGALGALAGTVRGQLPVEPQILSDRECQELGLGGDGTALFYPLSESGVFFDSAGSRIAVWYSGADADRALAALDAALKKSYPKTKQVIDKESPNESGMRLRAYDVILGNGRMATVEVSYSGAGAQRSKFAAQIVGMQLKN